MQNHSQLPTKKILYGSITGTVTFAANATTVGITAGLLLCTILASTAKPVLVEASCQIITIFDAVPVLTLGTDAAAANQILSAADITEGTVGFYPTSAAAGKIVLTANTPIYAKLTGGSTVGAAKLFLKITPLDPDQLPQTTV